MGGKRRYDYCGAVVCFGSILSHKWAGSTFAVSEEKARSNLTYQFKKQMGLVSEVPVVLPGQLIHGAISLK